MFETRRRGIVRQGPSVSPDGGGGGGGGEWEESLFDASKQRQKRKATKKQQEKKMSLERGMGNRHGWASGDVFVLFFVFLLLCPGCVQFASSFFFELFFRD